MPCQMRLFANLDGALFVTMVEVKGLRRRRHGSMLAYFSFVEAAWRDNVLAPLVQRSGEQP